MSHEQRVQFAPASLGPGSDHAQVCHVQAHIMKTEVYGLRVKPPFFFVPRDLANTTTVYPEK
eukprot:10066965-Lingulodinium_polyedra.AAC.1